MTVPIGSSSLLAGEPFLDPLPSGLKWERNHTTQPPLPKEDCRSHPTRPDARSCMAENESNNLTTSPSHPTPKNPHPLPRYSIVVPHFPSGRLLSRCRRLRRRRLGRATASGGSLSWVSPCCCPLVTPVASQ